MNSHTPGPWIRSKYGFQVLTGDERISICELNPNLPAITTISNSMLIAAAPDLLAACESWLCWFEQCAHLFDDLHVDEGAQMVIEQMKAAVAKAGGVSHE